MSSYKVTIPCTPVPKESVRLGKYGPYNPSAKAMLVTRQIIRSTLPPGELPLLSGPLLVIAHYVLPMPSTRPARKTLSPTAPHWKKPDIDNLDKFLGDALNGIIWADDSRITWHLVSKSWTPEKVGKTIIYCEEISPIQQDYAKLLSSITEHIRIDQC